MLGWLHCWRKRRDTFEKASNRILELVYLAGPMMPREEQRSMEAVLSPRVRVVRILLDSTLYPIWILGT